MEKFDKDKFGISKKSVFLVIALAFFSSGIYLVYWMIRNMGTLGENSEVKLWTGFLYIHAVIEVGVFADAITDSGIVTGYFSGLVGVVFFVLHFFVTIRFAEMLQEALYECKARDYRVEGLFAFLFSSIYFQYKINRNIG